MHQMKTVAYLLGVMGDTVLDFERNYECVSLTITLISFFFVIEFFGLKKFSVLNKKIYSFSVID